MIEVPRACLVADEIAEEAEFFSFGTNDLTQITFGFSRDDAGKFIKEYVDKNIFEKDPFVSIDRPAVGELTKLAIKKGRKLGRDVGGLRQVVSERRESDKVNNRDRKSVV